MVEPASVEPMTAVALDGTVDIARAAARLGWPHLRRYPYGSLFEVDGRRIYLFDVGAVVHQGYTKVDDGVRGQIEAATQRRYLERTADTWWVTEKSELQASAQRVGWDRVVLGRSTPEQLAAFALLLGQSAALERYELAADELVEEALQISRALEKTGRAPRNFQALVRQVGRISSDRLVLAGWFYLVDRPEETWEDASVAVLYDALFDALEFPQRHKAMLHKLETVEGVTRLVIELWQGRQANTLEWAIVLLIVAEIVGALVGLM